MAVKMTIQIMKFMTNIYIFKTWMVIKLDAMNLIVVKKLNKIIYRIDNNCVYIVDFWNLRMNPEKLQNRIND
ncbi:MAG: hypothetical protein J6U21_09940, partial [Bacteroidales bacterium]|nr:hypothetical protein [Bacteroidales bacterium]